MDPDPLCYPPAKLVLYQEFADLFGEVVCLVLSLWKVAALLLVVMEPVDKLLDNVGYLPNVLKWNRLCVGDDKVVAAVNYRLDSADKDVVFLQVGSGSMGCHLFGATCWTLKLSSNIRSTLL